MPCVPGRTGSTWPQRNTRAGAGPASQYPGSAEEVPELRPLFEALPKGSDSSGARLSYDRVHGNRLNGNPAGLSASLADGGTPQMADHTRGRVGPGLGHRLLRPLWAVVQVDRTTADHQ